MTGQVALKKPSVLIALGSIFSPSGPVFSTEYQAILDYADGQSFILPSLAVQIEQNNLVAALKNAGIWDSLDVFYNFYTDGDHNFAKINWKNPGTFQAVGTGHEPSFVILDGFTGNGTSQYLNTQWSPAAGVNFQQNESGVFLDVVVNNISAPIFAICGSLVSPLRSAHFIGGDGEFLFDTNSNISASEFFYPDPLDGFYHVTRVQASEANVSVDGVVQYALAITSTARTAPPVFLLAINNNSVPASYAPGTTIRVWGAGASLVDKEADLFTIWDAYRNAPFPNSLRAKSAYAKIIAYATAQAFTVPSGPQQVKQEKLILDLMDALIWDELDVFYNFYTDGNADFAKINWKNPGSRQILDAGATPPAFTVNSGFKGNGSPAYLNTQFFPDQSLFPADDSSFFADVADVSTPVTGVAELGAHGSVSTDYLMLRSRDVDGDLFAHLHSVESIKFSIGTPGAFFVHIQRDADTLSAAVDGEIAMRAASLIGTIASRRIFLCALNNNNSGIQYSTRRMRCFGYGKGLSGKEFGLYSAWMTYKGFEAEYQAVLDYATTQGFTLPSLANQLKQNALVVQLKSTAIWSGLDVFYNFYTDGDANFAKINWKNPGTFQAVGTGHEPTFTPLGGFTGNGTTQYLNTQWVPSGGVNFQQNEAGFFVDVVASDLAGFVAVCGSANNPFFSAHFFSVAGEVSADTSVDINDAVSNLFTSINGVYHINRVLSSESKWFIDGGLFFTAVEDSAARTASPVFLLAINNNGVAGPFGAATIYSWGAGASLTGKEAALFSALKIYRGIFENEYKAILNYATAQGFTLPSSANQKKQNALLVSLKNAGIWDELDVFYNFYTDGDHNFAKINWKEPGTYQAIGIGHEPTFTPLEGFSVEGTGGYLDTQWSPAGGVKFTQDDSCFFMDLIMAQLPSGYQFVCGSAADPDSGSAYLVSVGGAGFFADTNSQLLVAIYPDTSSPLDFFLQVVRAPDPYVSWNADGVPFFVDYFISSTPRTVLPVYLFTINANGPAGSCYAGIRVWGAGAGVSLADKAAALYNAWNTYKS